MGRVMYTGGGAIQIDVRFFENGDQPDIPTVATHFVPEPSSVVVAGLCLLGLIVSAPRRRHLSKSLAILLLVIPVSISSQATAMPVIDIVEVFDIDGSGNHAIDVYYTPSPGAEFNAWDLIVTPSHGRILAPGGPWPFNDDTTDGARVDTWTNTVASSIGAGPAFRIISSYDPGVPFPPRPSDPPPSAGGHIDHLFWTMFDLFTGDDATLGTTPYHMARILYSQDGGGTIEVRMFENLQPADFPFPASHTYGIPEPGSLTLGSLIMMNLITSRRVRQN